MIEDNVLNPPGPSVNQSDFTAYGALTYTIWKGNLEVLDLLLKHPGIDLENRTSCDNFSVPLLQAILKKDLKSAELLLKRGANVNANDCRMCTYPISALSMAAGGGGIQRFVSEPNLEMVKLLLRYGPKVGDLEVLAACGSYFDHKPNPEVCATVRGAKP
jgi:ankyrin repeat protein